MGRVHQPERGTELGPTCSGYDWPTHQANLRDVLEFEILPRDSGWSLSDACESVEPPSFGGVLDTLEQLKTSAIAEGLNPESTLPERIATVAMWNLARTDLDHANRCGAAWSVIPTAMVTHRWTFRNDEARVVIYHAQLDFFDRHNDVTKLSDLLHTCFVPPSNHPFLQRLRFRALLDRREHEEILKRELAHRSRTLDPRDPDRPPRRRKPTSMPRKGRSKRRKGR